MKIIKLFIFTVCIIINLLSCRSLSNNSSSQRIDLNIPDYARIMPDAESEIYDNKGSLFNGNNKSFFSDKKARFVNDLITITISERTNSSTKASRNLKDTSDYSMGGAIFQAKDDKKNSALADLINAANNLSNINLKSSSSNSFKGGGSTSRNDSFNTTITARVIKRMSNSTLYIKGTRELLINGEHQFISISGIIRIDDITPTNTIDSRYILDAKIYYDTKGSVSVSSKIPWGLSFLRNLWPF
jgi:flagellar L-ring protein precursor FlgH